MFVTNYPAAELTHKRRLNVRGVETGAAVTPRGEAEEPDESKYENSSVIPGHLPGEMFVLEWTGQDVEQHRVLL